MDQRPPTSTPSTTNLVRPRSPVNSGYVLSFLLLACDRAFPLVVAEPLRATPSRESGDTMVVSTASWDPPHKGKPVDHDLQTTSV